MSSPPVGPAQKAYLIEYNWQGGGPPYRYWSTADAVDEIRQITTRVGTETFGSPPIPDEFPPEWKDEVSRARQSWLQRLRSAPGALEPTAKKIAAGARTMVSEGVGRVALKAAGTFILGVEAFTIGYEIGEWFMGQEVEAGQGFANNTCQLGYQAHPKDKGEVLDSNGGLNGTQGTARAPAYGWWLQVHIGPGCRGEQASIWRDVEEHVTDTAFTQGGVLQEGAELVPYKTNDGEGVPIRSGIPCYAGNPQVFLQACVSFTPYAMFIPVRTEMWPADEKPEGAEVVTRPQTAPVDDDTHPNGPHVERWRDMVTKPVTPNVDTFVGSIVDPAYSYPRPGIDTMPGEIQDPQGEGLPDPQAEPQPDPTPQPTAQPGTSTKTDVAGPNHPGPNTIPSLDMDPLSEGLGCDSFPFGVPCWMADTVGEWVGGGGGAPVFSLPFPFVANDPSIDLASIDTGAAHTMMAFVRALLLVLATVAIVRFLFSATTGAPAQAPE